MFKSNSLHSFDLVLLTVCYSLQRLFHLSPTSLHLYFYSYGRFSDPSVYFVTNSVPHCSKFEIKTQRYGDSQSMQHTSLEFTKEELKQQKWCTVQRKKKPTSCFEAMKHFYSVCEDIKNKDDVKKNKYKGGEVGQLSRSYNHMVWPFEYATHLDVVMVSGRNVTLTVYSIFNILIICIC